MRDNANLVLIGLPESGKSTFIAALWHVVESEELAGSLTISALPKYREYLNAIRESWLGHKKLDRNKGEFIHELTMDLINKTTKSTAMLMFPDVPGELYENHFSTRKLREDFVAKIKSANGIILFINPDYLKKPILISDAIPMLQKEEEDENSVKPWDHKDAPTQVVLVDIIQMLMMFITKEFKIAIIISAWDVIYNSPDATYKKLTPAEYLKRELPLLMQFINSNKSFFKSNIYGISAQGDSYEETKKSMVLNKPSERIKVQEGTKISNDISQPIKWLIDVQ